MKPRDGALLRYEGWRSHACLDAGRIKSLLREKMLTCGNAGEWRSSHRLLEEKDAHRLLLSAANATETSRHPDRSVP